MREIKFRAWDKKKLVYYGWNSLAISSNNGKFSEWCISGDGITIRADSENLDLEQYTGLKDKNGVEIYEGDIATFEFEGGAKETSQIHWCNDQLRFKFGIYGFSANEKKDQKRFEVKGNIHENNPMQEIKEDER